MKVSVSISTIKDVVMVRQDATERRCMSLGFGARGQGRRHGFESGGTNSASEVSRKFFLTPHFLASGGQYIA